MQLTFLFQCPEKVCRERSSSKAHSLTKQSEPLCLHTYLILKAGLKNDQDTTVVSKHEVDRNLTVKGVVQLIRSEFPTATSDGRTFLKANKSFIQKLCQKKDISSELKKHSVKKCPNCSQNLVKWHHKTKDSYIITLSEIKKITIDVQFFNGCKSLSYYDLYSYGLVPVNNKVC